METTLPTFTPLEESLFLTLCGRALDNRSSQPILADKMADEIVRTLGYDCGKFRLSASPIFNIALRAKKLDEVALRFVTRHPDAVALDLGAGLDSRMFRIVPPPTVDWYDVDFPARTRWASGLSCVRRCRRRSGEFDPAVLDCVECRLGTVSEAELPQDVRYVVLDGPFRDVEFLRDLAVRKAVGD